MQIELKRIQREIGITTIFVTHDQEEALTLSDKIGILKGGRMIQAGAPREVYNHPVDIFTAEFLGEANILRPAGGALPSESRIHVPEAATTGAALAVRPENMRVTASEPEAAELSKMPGVLVRRVFAGALGTCLVERDGTAFKVLAKDEEIPDIAEGSPVWVSWRPEHTIVIPDR